MQCPSCFGNNISFMGKINSYHHSVGIYQGDIYKNVVLYCCKECHLCFKWPRLPKIELDKLYKDGIPVGWDIKPSNRRDWLLAKNILTSLTTPKKVLDVGCWDGGFLNYLSSSWERYGIEINNEAIRAAILKNIQIISQDINDIDNLNLVFNAITAFDIIEHTYSPELFLTNLSNALSRNGILIIASGNTESFLWRLSKNNNWYCSIPEHLSFINISWCHYIADKLNLEIQHINKYAHSSKANVFNSFIQIFKYSIYLAFPHNYGYVRKLYNRIFKNQYSNDNAIYRNPPQNRNCKDHIIVVFKKR
jgi:2-polyprenyl-3-methyl-5-hydroxy-6-metoxy-1,4-benzoquinol methylase